MSTLTAESKAQLRAEGVRFKNRALVVALSDGRELSVPLNTVPWLAWLARATPRERTNWEIEPGGYAIYWPDLDDGVEVCHLLDVEPLSIR